MSWNAKITFLFSYLYILTFIYVMKPWDDEENNKKKNITRRQELRTYKFQYLRSI